MDSCSSSYLSSIALYELIFFSKFVYAILIYENHRTNSGFHRKLLRLISGTMHISRCDLFCTFLRFLWNSVWICYTLSLYFSTHSMNGSSAKRNISRKTISTNEKKTIIFVTLSQRSHRHIQVIVATTQYTYCLQYARWKIEGVQSCECNGSRH